MTASVDKEWTHNLQLALILQISHPNYNLVKGMLPKHRERPAIYLFTGRKHVNNTEL